jgi:hypothetical protein
MIRLFSRFSDEIIAIIIIDSSMRLLRGEWKGILS